MIIPSKNIPFCFVFQGKFHLNTKNGFLGVQNEESSSALLLLFMGICNYHGGLFDLGFGEGCGGGSSDRRDEMSCQILVQDENQCFLLCGLSVIASRTDLLN